MSDVEFVNFLGGWNSKKNEGQVNLATNFERYGMKLFVENKAGEQMEIKHFFIKPNDKSGPNANAKWPDFQGTFVLGGDEG